MSTKKIVKKAPKDLTVEVKIAEAEIKIAVSTGEVDKLMSYYLDKARNEIRSIIETKYVK